MNTKNRTWFIAASVGALMLVGGLLIFSRGGDEQPDESADAGRSGGAGAWTGGFFPGGDRKGEVPVRGELIDADMAQETRRRAQFPNNSIPIAANKPDPMRLRVETQVERSHPRKAGDTGPFLYFQLRKRSFEPGEPLVIFGYVRDSSGARLPIGSSEIMLTEGGPRGKVWARTEFLDGGKGADRQGGDLLYTATFDLPKELRSPNVLPKIFTVVARAESGSQTMVGSIGLTVGTLEIEHTGVFRDRIQTDEKGAHLALDADFNVKRKGRYYFQASVYEESGKTALGHTASALELQPGKQTVALQFYGKIFCDRKANGPYVIRYFAYSNVNVVPPVEAEGLENVHRTARYSASQFTCQSYDDPDMLRRAQILEAAAEEGRLRKR